MIKKIAALTAAFGMVATVVFTNSILAGETLVRDSIQSEGYTPGSAGWSINRDGTAEFNNVTVRGRIIGGDENGVHIEINGVEVPNGLAFYTGNANETAPGAIQPFDQGSQTNLLMQSPEMDGGSQAQLFLTAFAAAFGGRTAAQISADDITFNRFDSTGTVKTNGEIERIDFTVGGDEIWHVVGAAGQPAFAGNWAVQGGRAVGFYKDASGRVQLRGNAAEPVALSVNIFTLPVGYRPTQNMSWGVKANNDAGTVGWITINTVGQVQVTGNVAALRVQTILDAVSFPTW